MVYAPVPRLPTALPRHAATAAGRTPIRHLVPDAKMSGMDGQLSAAVGSGDRTAPPRGEIGAWGGMLIVVGALVSTLSSANANMLGAAAAAVLLLLGHLPAIVALANVAAIVAMTLVNAAAIHAARDPASAGIWLPLGPALPLLGLVSALAQLGFIGWRHTLVGLALVPAGTSVYGLRGRHHLRHHLVLVEHLARGDTPAGRALRRPAPGRP